MTENVEIPHKKTKKSRTIWVLSVISLVYIGIVYLLIKETATCDKVAISANWFKGFWDQYLGCRSVNELGDTLAGAFAPVAFLWLMGAVFIQSQELKAQREELDETQEVMRAQLQVSIQQVEETKASTALFKKQTEMLEKEQQLRQQKESDLLFDSQLAAFLTAFKKDHIGYDLGFKLDGSTTKNWTASSLPDPTRLDELTPTIGILGFYRGFSLPENSRKAILTNWENEHLFNILIAQISDLIALQSELSNSHKSYAASLELVATHETLKNISERLKVWKRSDD
ncbi:hypothetical protein ABE530_11805 [Brucella sp. TWI559]